MKTALFVILDKWADWEAAYLSSALMMLGGGEFAVKTVSLTREPVESIGGFFAVPDYDIASTPDEYEAMVLIGGMSWRTDAAKKVLPLVRECVKRGKVLGGICDAAGFLGTAGLLNEVLHTANDLDDLKAWAKDVYTGEENFRGEQAVSNGGIVTANGTAALEFAKEVLLSINAAPTEKIDGWYNFHKLGVYAAPTPEM